MKDKEQKNKKTLNTRVIKAFSVAAVFAAAAGAVTMAWFSFNDEDSFNDLHMKSTGERFELASCSPKQGIYDDGLVYVNNRNSREDDQAVIRKGTQHIYDGKDYFRTDSEIELTSVSWMMSSESNIGNTENCSGGAGPGECGALSFYVIPKEDGELKMDFELDFTLFSDNTQSGEQAVYSAGRYYYQLPDESDISKLLKGHLLFFESRTENGQYSDRIYDYGTHSVRFSRTFTEAEKDVPQKVDIYWVWPYVAGMTILPDGHKNLGNYISVFENNTAGDQVDNDKTRFLKDMSENYGYYFAGVKNYENLQKILSSGNLWLTLNSMAEGNSMNIFPELSAAWNKGDQRLGIETDYIELTLTARSE